MSRELRDRADNIIKELKEILEPLTSEISNMKYKDKEESKK